MTVDYETYGPCPVNGKRGRRTKKQMEAVRQQLEDYLAAEGPVTVRGAFYGMVTRGVLEKTEKQVDRVSQILVDMRVNGRVPFEHIADNTRWMRRPTTWGSLAEALEHTQGSYRRALWQDQDAYVEIWLEKDAQAGVLIDVTARWDVPLMVSKGFASVTYLHEAAMAIREQGKPTYIYHFGDHDPSGVKIDAAIENRLRQFAPEAEIHFQRVAVLPWQIEEWSLPTRPTKEGSSHAKTWKGGDSVELDAIPPSRLREICEQCIVQHIDVDDLNRHLAVERAERETLQSMLARGLTIGGDA